MAQDTIQVLLVDDDEDELVIARDLLGEIEAEYFEVEWRSSYEAGLAALERKQYDVCVVDYRMGSRNGVELIKEAIARGCRAPFILLTAQGDHEIDMAAMRAGAADYLSKSQLTADILERSIRYGIQQRRSEEQRMTLLQEQAARREAEAANRAKDEFLATLSHELRTPLNAILGWVQLLRIGALDQAESHQAVETIERNAKAQAQLIEDLLDVSRIVSGKIRLKSAPLCLARTVEAAMGVVRPTAESKGVELVADLDGQIPPILGDFTRLQQVIWNLLSNAVKFTPAGGRVTVRLRQVGPEAQVSVQDTGQGIDPQFLPHVFERFRQADSSTTRPHSGLGLGLAIVRNLIELHGGHVWAQSEGKGKGSTFAIGLPLARSSGSGDAPDSAPGRLSEDGRLDGLRVLVVDDDADARGFVSKALEMQGAQVRMAASAMEAFSMIKQSAPDLLVSDIAMPGEDGYALVRRIRASDDQRIRKLPAVAITAYAADHDRRQAMEAGFAAHLSKPIQPTELVTAIQQVLRSSCS